MCAELSADSVTQTPAATHQCHCPSHPTVPAETHFTHTPLIIKIFDTELQENINYCLITLSLWLVIIYIISH